MKISKVGLAVVFGLLLAGTSLANEVISYECSNEAKDVKLTFHANADGAQYEFKVGSSEKDSSKKTGTAAVAGPIEGHGRLQGALFFKKSLGGVYLSYGGGDYNNHAVVVLPSKDAKFDLICRKI